MTFGSTATVRNGCSGLPDPAVPHWFAVTAKHGECGHEQLPQMLSTRPSLSLPVPWSASAEANSGWTCAIGSHLASYSVDTSVSEIEASSAELRASLGGFFAISSSP